MFSVFGVSPKTVFADSFDFGVSFVSNGQIHQMIVSTDINTGLTI
jgi:hypothetical protein